MKRTAYCLAAKRQSCVGCPMLYCKSRGKFSLALVRREKHEGHS